MSANLVAPVIPIDQSPVTPTAREQRLTAAVEESYEKLREALREAQIIAPVGLNREVTKIDHLLWNLWKAGSACRWYQDGRVRRAEAVVRAALDTLAVSGEQRQILLTTLYGRPGARRDSRVLSDAELTLIDHYRRTDAPGKQMIRTLFARLAASSASADAADAADEEAIIRARDGR